MRRARCAFLMSLIMISSRSHRPEAARSLLQG
jgi:hypothetical protein